MKVLGVICLAFIGATASFGSNFSFNGTFTSDAQVALFNFNVGSTSTVTLQTWSYAGGVDAAGATIPRGGFDPILALFDSTGAEINQNDDGGSSVPADSVTGVHYDTYLQSTLAPGSYTVSVQEYDNFAVGPNLSNGFARTGQGNFTSAFGCSAGIFCDVSGVPAGDSRNGNWEFDIDGVNSATGPGNGGGSNTPEPASVGLLLLGVGGLVVGRKKLRA